MSETGTPNSSEFSPYKRLDTLPFECVPHQSKLFLDYLKDPQALKNFYPTALKSHTEIPLRIPELLANYTVDRNRLADALSAMNKRWAASDRTLQNIEKLRASDAVAVVTGQQAGIFTGPLYTIYKAISTIKVAACLEGRGINAVPVFWIATEDHDFAEVAGTFVNNRDGSLSEIKISAEQKTEGLPVGKIKLDDSIKSDVEKLFDALPKTEFSDELQKMVEDAYQPGRSLGDAFALMMARLFGEFGLILFDPLDDNLKRLAAPIYAQAVEKSAEIIGALIKRSKELEAAGYHAQVLVEETSFPLFWLDSGGKRHALRRTADGKLRAKGIERDFELSELKEIAETAPWRLSPNVNLRNVVQDYLLPTAVYFGGAAEIAYSAQNSEVYRILQRPVTPMLPRASVTIIEPKIARTFDKYNLSMSDFFCRPEGLFPKIVEEFLNSDTPGIFVEAEEIINTQLNRLDKNLTQVEPTLAKSLARRRPKILYHLAALRNKFYHAEIQKNAVVKQQIETASASIFPHKNLQERTINVTSLLARHGDNLVHWIWQAVDVDSFEHQIIYL